MVKHENVTSSNVKDFAYDPASKKLSVTFKNGGTYDYANVPPEKYLDMCKAESYGKFLHQSIKGHHDFTKVDSGEERV